MIHITCKICYLTVIGKASSPQQAVSSYDLGGVESYMLIFNSTGVGAPNPFIIQGSTIYKTKQNKTKQNTPSCVLQM